MREKSRQLNEREREALIWAGRGESYRGIADMMGIGFDSVCHYLRGAREKLYAKSTTHAVALVLARGIVEAREIEVQWRISG